MYSSNILRSIVGRCAGREEETRSSRFNVARTRDRWGPAGARMEVVTADLLDDDVSIDIIRPLMGKRGNEMQEVGRLVDH
jgi:hypothetical protein